MFTEAKPRPGDPVTFVWVNVEVMVRSHGSTTYPVSEYRLTFQDNNVTDEQAMALVTHGKPRRRTMVPRFPLKKVLTT